MNLFLYSCALVKLYHIEAGSKKLHDFIKTRVFDLTLSIADIASLEFHSAVLIQKTVLATAFSWEKGALYDDRAEFLKSSIDQSSSMF